MRVFNEQDREEVILVLKPEEVLSLMDALEKVTKKEKNDIQSMIYETLANETDY